MAAVVYNGAKFKKCGRDSSLVMLLKMLTVEICKDQELEKSLHLQPSTART